MLWVDKYRPMKIDDLSYNTTITQRIQCITKYPLTVPHLLVYGPTGCGKKTRIRIILKQLFGNAVISKLKLDKRTFNISTGNSSSGATKAIDINMISSPYHIELSPSDAGINDRHIIQDVIKEIASTKNVVSNLNAMTMSSSTSTNTNENTTNTTNTAITKNNSVKPQYKVVVILDVDLLTKQAQAALRRTMEKYTTTCRLILCCTNSSKVIEPVKSRCLLLRIPSPTIINITTVLNTICQKEGISSTIINDEIRYTLACESSNNIRRAILMMEAYYVQHRNSATTQGNGKPINIPKPDWELYIQQLAIDITNEQSPQRLVAAREKLYELISNCIPGTVIIKTLTQQLLINLDDPIKMDIIYWSAFYEHRISLGSKEIFHLEAFIAKYMSLYKQYLHDYFG